MDTSAYWYRITLISRYGREVGSCSQPIPPSIGDNVKIHYSDNSSFRVIDREFNYVKGFHVTITLDID